MRVFLIVLGVLLLGVLAVVGTVGYFLWSAMAPWGPREYLPNDLAENTYLVRPENVDRGPVRTGRPLLLMRKPMWEAGPVRVTIIDEAKWRKIKTQDGNRQWISYLDRWERVAGLPVGSEVRVTRVLAFRHNPMALPAETTVEVYVATPDGRTYREVLGGDLMRIAETPVRRLIFQPDLLASPETR